MEENEKNETQEETKQDESIEELLQDDGFEDIQKKPISKKNLLFIGAGALIVIVIILLILITSMVIGGKKEDSSDKKEDEQEEKDKKDDKKDDKKEDKKEDEEEEEEEDTRPRIPRTEKKMYLYKIGDTYVEDSYVPEADRKNKNTVGINIEDLDAKVMAIYPVDKYARTDFPVYVFFKDGEKMKYFYVPEHRTYSAGISSEYKKYELLTFENELKAIFYSSKKENGIYNVAKKKYMYKDQYDSFVMMSATTLMGVKKGGSDIISLNEEKVIMDVPDDGGKSSVIGGFPVVEKTDESGKTLYTIYNSNYEVIEDRVSRENWYVSGNVLYLSKNNKVYGYDTTGGIKYNSSRTYDEIYFVNAEYFVAAYNNTIYVISYDEEETELCSYNSMYKLSYSDSGYKVKSTISNRKEEGLYIVFAESEASDGTYSGVEYFFNKTTKKVSKTNVTKIKL